jgi:anti-sigma regulatory factor (Ser/Thr protein kinase)
MTTTLRIPAELNQLATVRRFVQETAIALGASAMAADQLTLAVDESITNIIEHGYQHQPGKIEIEIRRGDGAVVVHLRDRAPPFDPTRLPDPDVTLPLSERHVGGLGIFLTRRFVDAVTYRLITEGGNELTLTKKNGSNQPPLTETTHEHDHRKNSSAGVS